MKETYKPIKNFPDYEISNLGRVRSNRLGKKTILQPAPIKAGYLIVNLMLPGDNKHRTLYVHRLVAEHFCRKARPIYQVHHKDGCKTNNSAANLTWLTCKSNIRHAWEQGLSKSHASQGRMLSEREVHTIDFLEQSNIPRKRIAELFEVTRPTISNVINRKRYYAKFTR